jgi:deoxycytidine triphosphate deaminase
MQTNARQLADDWPKPDEPVTPAYWDDPLPDWQGMLSSDLIAYYNAKVGGMIGPWDDGLLKPASYELTLGRMYVRDGEIEMLTPDRPWLEIPSNSIVFVSMAQWVRLPHYIAARFDLAIEYIYQGILLGTGPQVDPGFQGYLSCPLHNISNDAVHMRLGWAFAKMDFAKTSGLWHARREHQLGDVNNEHDLYAHLGTGRLVGLDSHPMRFFKEAKRWRTPIIDAGYAGSKTVSSSVKSLEEDVLQNRRDVREFGDEFKRVRRFGLAAGLALFLAVVGLLITLAQLDRSYTDAKIGSITSHGTTTRSSVNSGP